MKFLVAALVIMLVSLVSPGAAGQVVGGLEGQRAPDFTVELIDGSTFELKDYQGRPVLIYFFTTWCGPCGTTMPHVNEFASKQHDVAVLAISIGERPATVIRYLENNGYTLATAVDNGRIANQYLIRPIPTTVLINQEGVVQRRHIGSYNEALLDNWYLEVVSND